jgi:ABC-type Zn uptake system ZnuABC Zn-binding protein ZnuA
MAHAVAGENAFVLCLLTTQGPHDYHYNPLDQVKLRGADLFVANGLTLDDEFVNRMLRNNKNSALKALNLGAFLEHDHPTLLLEGQEHEEEGGGKHRHGPHDPHLWLGPPQAMVMTNLIAAELARIDPANKTGYEARAAKFCDELKKLEEYGKNAFKDKKNKNIVTQHESLAYFAKAFDLHIVGSIQAFPGTDPDAAGMKNLIALCEKEKVKVFAVEPQYSAKQAEVLQNTLKKKHLEVRIVQIDPLETATIPEGSWMNPDPSFYLQMMRHNIDMLARALP